MNRAIVKQYTATLALVVITVVCSGRSSGAEVQNGMPVVAPRGDRIAFLSNRTGNDDVYIVSTDGTGERALTSTPENETNVAWTRRGKIVFAIVKDERSHVYTIDVDGKNRREMAEVPGRAVAYSPDGKRLLYMGGTWTESILNVAAPDGANPKPITNGSSIAWNARWSPDGKWIAFTGRSDPKAELAIFQMDGEGSVPQQLSDVPAGEGGAQCPAWSPDGSQIAFQVNSRSEKGLAHIWILDRGGGAAHKLAAHTDIYLDETPSWYPDGNRIAFQSNRTGRMEVWMMNVDGTAPQQVTGTTH